MIISIEKIVNDLRHLSKLIPETQREYYFQGVLDVLRLLDRDGINQILIENLISDIENNINTF